MAAAIRWETLTVWSHGVTHSVPYPGPWDDRRVPETFFMFSYDSCLILKRSKLSTREKKHPVILLQHLRSNSKQNTRKQIGVSNQAKKGKIRRVEILSSRISKHDILYQLQEIAYCTSLLFIYKAMIWLKLFQSHCNFHVKCTTHFKEQLKCWEMRSVFFFSDEKSNLSLFFVHPVQRCLPQCSANQNRLKRGRPQSFLQVLKGGFQPITFSAEQYNNISRFCDRSVLLSVLLFLQYFGGKSLADS